MHNKMKQMFKNIRYKLSFLEVLDSPFIGLTLKWYFGDIQFGTPYFLPRKWVKCTMKDAHNAWSELKNKPEDISKTDWLKKYAKGHTKPIPIKYFGFHFTTLGWKTKWDEYRFEWSPSISLVIFGKQLYVSIMPNIEEDSDLTVILDSYWEAWLTYKYKTDKSKSQEERLKQLKEIYSCTWINGKGKETDYYDYILK